jgi:hypothetical protein
MCHPLEVLKDETVVKRSVMTYLIILNNLIDWQHSLALSLYHFFDVLWMAPIKHIVSVKKGDMSYLSRHHIFFNTAT